MLVRVGFEGKPYCCYDYSNMRKIFGGDGPGLETGQWKVQLRAEGFTIKGMHS